MTTQTACPECGKPIKWDTDHDPHAWRHLETISRWCSNPVRYPAGATDPDRRNTHPDPCDDPVYNGSWGPDAPDCCDNCGEIRGQHPVEKFPLPPMDKEQLRLFLLRGPKMTDKHHRGCSGEHDEYGCIPKRDWPTLARCEQFIRVGEVALPCPSYLNHDGKGGSYCPNSEDEHVDVTGWFHSTRSVPAHFFEKGKPWCQDSDPGDIIWHDPDEQALERLCGDCMSTLRSRTREAIREALKKEREARQ